MSTAAEARLLAVVDRIAAAVGVDPSNVTVSVEHARQGRRWLASVTWNARATPSVLLFDTRRFAETPEEAVDRVIACIELNARRGAESASAAIVAAQRAVVAWSAVRVACEVMK